MTPSAYLEGLVPALGWTLAHFLWQGALIALVLQVLLKACRTARTRHDLALAGLVLMALAPIATFAWLKAGVRIVFVPPGFPGLPNGATWETLAVAAWLTGVAVLAIRTAGGLLVIERLRRTAQPLPPEWAQRCRALHRRMTSSLGVVFAQSEAIAAPLVAGWVRPMVLIPTAALIRFPADQLEALILHELAHVRRLDAIANLIQTVVETALFYHPAVWWVSRRIRVEREHCCDDLAVAAIADPALYVRALQGIESWRAAPAGVLAASGGDLKSRAARILGLAGAPERPALSRTAAVVILTAAAAAMTHSAAVQATPARRPAPSPTPSVAPIASTAPDTALPTPAARSDSDIAPPAQTGAPIIVLAEAAPVVATTPLPVATAKPAPAPQTLVIASAAASAGPTQSLSPVTVTPAAKPDVRIDVGGSMPNTDPNAAQIWPSTAYTARFDGHVTMSCRIDVYGLAEHCEVLSESPKGKKFGAAALQMRTTLKLPPTMGPEGPIETVKTIAVDFTSPDTYSEQTGSGSCTSGSVAANGMSAGDVTCTTAYNTIVYNGGLPMTRVTMVDFPIWAQTPGFGDLARAYPAKGGGAEGYVAAHCRVLRSGELTQCAAIKEFPEGRGFAWAARDLTAKFRMAPAIAATHHDSPLWVDVPIRMPPPAKAQNPTVLSPLWLTRPDPGKPLKLFPPEAVAAGQTSGRGVARCTVAADGALTACAPDPEEPASPGFSEAAAKIASRMKMNLWSGDGAPVAGGVVHVPIRLNLKGA